MYLCWLRAGTFPEGQTYLIFHLWPEGENIELWDQAWISSPRVDDESIICSKNHLKVDSLIACICQAPVFHSNPAEKWYDPCRLQRASPLTVVLKSVGPSASPGNPHWNAGSLNQTCSRGWGLLNFFSKFSRGFLTHFKLRSWSSGLYDRHEVWDLFLPLAGWQTSESPACEGGTKLSYKAEVCRGDTSPSLANGI